MNQPILLQSDRLSVSVSRPGGAYRRGRFDWTGFVTQVTLDGTHTFCGVEDPVEGKGTGGMGLCNAYSAQDVLGYDRAAPGGSFVRIGIGTLTKPDEAPFSVFREYDIQPFAMSYRQPSPEQVDFFVEPRECGGYAFALEKRCLVKGNTLSITCTLENRGNRDVTISDYNHNFLLFDHMAAGPEYLLQVPYPFEVRVEKGKILTGAKTMQVADFGARDYYFFVSGFQGRPHSWELTHRPTGLFVREDDDFEASMFRNWGVAHALCPEVFITFPLPVGESRSWTRAYTFGQKTPGED